MRTVIALGSVRGVTGSGEQIQQLEQDDGEEHVEDDRDAVTAEARRPERADRVPAHAIRALCT